MKIRPDALVIISPGFAADELDSTCLPMQQALVKAINQLYPECGVQIIALQYPFRDRTYSWHGNTITSLDGRNRNGFSRWMTWYSTWQQLRKLKRSNHIRGILSFWLDECAMIGHRFAQLHKLQHRCWMLGQDARPGNRYAASFKKYPGELVALSDFIASTFKDNYGIMPGSIIPPGVLPAAFKTDPRIRSIDILAVGSLIPLKQYHLLVQVANSLVTRFPNLRIVHCGKGPELVTLQKMIEEAGLERNIQLLGEKPNEEVLTLMQQSKILLHPSAYEGFGVVCLEALYAGAQVISFCRPQNAWIRNWHYVDTLQEMTETTATLLAESPPSYEPIQPYLITNTARSIMALFD